MKRLLFSVTGVSMLVALSGCGTPNGPFKGSDGRALTTATGATIEVVDHPRAHGEPKVDDSKSKSYLDHLKVKDSAEKTPIQISREEAESALAVQEATTKAVTAEISRLVRMSDFKSLTTVVVFVGGRPQVTEHALSKYSGAMLSKGAMIALRALIEQEIRKHLIAVVYPKMVEATVAKIRPVVEQYVANGEFAKAREAIWVASTRGIPEVDNPVRKQVFELMHGLVNPTEWKGIEAKIEAVYKAAMDSKQYKEGIEKLKQLRSSLRVKEYAALIDRKLALVKAELVKLGVPEADMAEIFKKQAELVAEAAKIKDVRDEYVKKPGVVPSVPDRENPNFADYYARLDDYHATLIKYNCTKENADRLVKNLDRDLKALIDLLNKAAVVEAVSADKGTLLLGTRSLNDRIHNLVALRLVALESALREVELGTKLKEAKEDLEKQVRALVAEGKFEEARELIWTAATTGEGRWKVEWDTEMFSFGLVLLRDLVNPKDWERIEKDIVGTFKKLASKGDFVALRKFLEEYPLIRQHTVQLCDQLAKVKAEAEALGADSKAAEAAAQVACGMVTEAEKLVDHLDQLVSVAAEAGKELDMSSFQKELQIYRAKLAAYHATPENVEKIVKQLEMSLMALVAKPTNPNTTRLQLGTNAVNDRIRKLTAHLLSILDQTKKEWQDAEHKRVMTDLEKRVRAAVKEKRFADARNYIRDEKLIGHEAYDLDIYVLRVGLLDCCVNPAQLDFLLAQIDKDIAALMKAKDYAGVIKYCEEYKYVHDQYAQVESALEAVKNAMLALEISKDETSLDRKRFFKSIEEILEKRRETWKPERDLAGVEKALAQVAKALYAHLVKHPELIGAETAKDLAHIREDLAKLERNITTWELNELLRARLFTEVLRGCKLSYYEEAKKQLAIQEYGKFLVAIDAEVSFDSQIAMAEEGISRQLGVKCGTATFKINALLGEYARMFRLLKKGIKLDQAQATTILLGAAYLDQAQVIKRALDLGADVNGVSDRDPRGRTALALAIDAGNSHLVKLLVEAEASLAAVDKDGNAIAHYAAKSGNLSVLKAVTEGASIDVKNNLGNTPLAIAVVRNQPALVEAVIAAVKKGDRKVFVNSANKQGETAFNIAAHFGSRDVLDALAAAGAEYGTKDLVLAEKADHVAIAQWLINQGLDVNAVGVMDDACPATRTGRYLISEGGLVSKHACVLCDDGLKKKALEKLVVGPKKSVSTKECEANCQPQPIDELLVPSAK